MTTQYNPIKRVIIGAAITKVYEELLGDRKFRETDFGSYNWPPPRANSNVPVTYVSGPIGYSVKDIVAPILENNTKPVKINNLIQSDNDEDKTCYYFNLFQGSQANYIHEYDYQMDGADPNFSKKRIRKLYLDYKETYPSSSQGDEYDVRVKVVVLENKQIFIIKSDQTNTDPAKKFVKGNAGNEIEIPALGGTSTISPPASVTADGSRNSGGRTGGGGRTGRGGRYKPEGDFPIPFERPRRKGTKIQEIQKKLSQIKNKNGEAPYAQILSSGSSAFGSKYSNWSNSTDGVFGPRTLAAIKAFFAKDTSAPLSGDAITKDVYDKIINFSGFSKAGSTEVAAVLPAMKQDAQEKQEDSKEASVAVESISYKKDLLKSTKNRHKEVEKLVFERLVKGCK